MSNKTKTKKVTKKWIEDTFLEVSKRMNLSDYELSVEYMDYEEDGTAISVYPDIIYKRANFSVYPSVFNESRETVLEYIKHELVHIIIQPIVSIAEEHASHNRLVKPVENAVEHIRRLIK